MTRLEYTPGWEPYRVEREMSGKQMCEGILLAFAISKVESPYTTPLELWNRSPDGDLTEVFMLWDWACWYLGRLVERALV